MLNHIYCFISCNDLKTYLIVCWKEDSNSCLLVSRKTTTHYDASSSKQRAPLLCCAVASFLSQWMREIETKNHNRAHLTWTRWQNFLVKLRDQNEKEETCTPKRIRRSARFIEKLVRAGMEYGAAVSTWSRWKLQRC